MSTVDFYFDVMCPWAYQASLWIREAAKERGIAVTWRFFSLEEVNREAGKKHPWERDWSYGWSMLRVAAFLRRMDGGNGLVDRFYRAAGRELHEQARKVHTPEGVARVLEDIGLDAAIARAAIEDDTTHDDVRADHDRAVALGCFGVPTLVIDGTATLFGPVVMPAPAGRAAARLWDLVAGWAEFPRLYELRRVKSAGDHQHIESALAPYYAARDWRTVTNPVA